MSLNICLRRRLSKNIHANINKCWQKTTKSLLCSDLPSASSDFLAYGSEVDAIWCLCYHLKSMRKTLSPPVSSVLECTSSLCSCPCSLILSWSASPGSCSPSARFSYCTCLCLFASLTLLDLFGSSAAFILVNHLTCEYVCPNKDNCDAAL